MSTLRLSSAETHDERATETFTPTVVTLVHGTFPGGAAWTRQDSRLVRAVKRLIPGGEIRTFQWSGANSHRARLQAAKEFRAYLVHLADENPGARHFLIAHSHGGNVIMYSLRELTRKFCPAGIITLGTPFIVAATRDLSPTLRAIRIAIIGALGLLSVFLILWAVDVFYFTEPLFRLYELEVSGIVALLSAGAILVTLRRVTAWIDSYSHKRLIARQQHDIIRLNLPRIDDVPTLVLHVERDEAGLLLRTLDRISEIPFCLWQPAVILWSVVIFGVAWSVITGGIIWFLVEFNPEIRTTGKELVQGLLLFAPLVAGGTLLFFILLTAGFQAIMALWTKIFRGHALGFGESGIFENWLGHITADVLPPNTRNFTSRAFRLSGKGLRHSLIHDDVGVINTICEWIMMQLKIPPAGLD